LERCIAALRDGLGPDDELHVVSGPHPCHPGAARNLGVAHAKGDVLVFVDADVEVRGDALARFRAAFEQDPTLSATFGSYDDEPGEDGVVSSFRNLLHHHVHQGAAGEASTFWTGLGAVRRSAFENVGGFDPELRYLEDVDLGMRLAAKGHRIVLDPWVQGKHLKRWSLVEMTRTDFTGRALPWIDLVLRHRHSSSVLNLGWRHRLSAVAAAVAVVSVVAGRIRVALAAVVALVALNRDFYTLLARKLGLRGAGIGVALHGLHHLTGLAALPIGLARHFGRRGIVNER
jgi:hypothetical protein